MAQTAPAPRAADSTQTAPREGIRLQQGTVSSKANLRSVSIRTREQQPTPVQGEIKIHQKHSISTSFYGLLLLEHRPVSNHDRLKFNRCAS